MGESEPVRNAVSFSARKASTFCTYGRSSTGGGGGPDVHALIRRSAAVSRHTHLRCILAPENVVRPDPLSRSLTAFARSFEDVPFPLCGRVRDAAGRDDRVHRRWFENAPETGEAGPQRVAGQHRGK